MATGCYPQPPVPTGIAIHENGTGTATSYGSQSPLGLAFKGCHQSLTLCPCFLVSNPTHLASPGDAHSATWPPNYATGTISLCSLPPIPLQPLSVSPASHPSTRSPCLFQKHPPPPPGKEMHPLRKMHKGIQKEGTTTHGTINLIAVSISVQVHLGTYADINIHYFLM